jgi:hypothetical protein
MEKEMWLPFFSPNPGPIGGAWYPNTCALDEEQFAFTLKP